MINDGNITTDALNGKIVVTSGTRDDKRCLSREEKTSISKATSRFLMSLKKGQLDSRRLFSSLLKINTEAL
jgi:hypothetical protein